MGVALAFFPLEDRPLAKWIILFIKAIYSPTLYVWRQMPTKYSYFQAENDSITQLTSQQTPQQVKQSNGIQSQETIKLESEEKKFLDKLSSDLVGSTAKVVPVIVAQKKTGESQKPQVIMPETKKVDFQPTTILSAQVKPEMVEGSSQAQAFKLVPSVGMKGQNVQNAKFSTEAAPPLPPTKANVVVGQVVDTQGKIVENAILEIRDSEGRPVRALRSNKLGHFMIVTPLASGNYEITTEKDGLYFNTVSLNAKGEIIPPLAIWAKSKKEERVPEQIKV